MKRACLLVVIVACAWTHDAFAQSRVVVRSFSGGDERVRDAVVQAVAESDGMQAVTNKEADGAARSSSADLTTEAGRVAVARALNISAFVEGDVQKRGKTTEVSLRVYNGRDGALLTVVGMHTPNAAITGEVQKRVRNEVGGAIRRGQPPPPLEPLPPPPVAGAPPPVTPTPETPTPVTPSKEPTPEPVARPTPSRAESTPEPRESSKPLRYALELGAGVLAVSRTYTYRDALIELPEHTGAAVPALRIDARWYPATHLTRGVLSNLGVEVSAQVMWPSDATRNNTAFTTTSTELGVAARARIPISEHELGLVAGYGGHTFTLDEQDGQDPGLPNVAYSFVRFGAEGRLQLHEVVQLQLRAEYLLLTGFGELGDREWFPHVSGGGVDAELYLGFDISEVVQLIISGGTTRYFLSLDPRPTDPGVSDGRIAGGVTDQYVHGLFGIRLRPY